MNGTLKTMNRSLLNISDLKRSEIYDILSLQDNPGYLKKKNIGLIFEKPSTRTRMSFTVGINNLGGAPIDIRFEDLNISRNESFEDTFRALNCYLDGLIFRTTNHNRIIKASKFFDKPIINALSDLSHPCQTLGDLFTIKEKFGKLDCNVLWMGDMNNVCFSLVEAAKLIEEIKLTICTPFSISDSNNWDLSKNIDIVSEIKNINLKNIQCVMTDVFISMNDEISNEKKELLMPYKVNSDLISKISNEGIFMHCLPANIGLEVSEDVIRGSKSIVWKQAYNRMIAQNKLLQFLF
jgi:ornithine carbamoyltransferase